ncbi:MAG: GTPase HflX [Planctomycetota bacterium]|nr:GTPase HflX [Planctomycetota bacterium]MDW8373359.1 GTPase HflX [Planctomycetota bacterium]
MTKAPLPVLRAAIPAVLMLTVPNAQRDTEDERRHEMESLLDTAGRSAVAVLVQHCDRPIAATYIGSGKVQELAALVRHSGAEEVVFDCALSPRQQANLEQACGCRVYDYEWLILEIFARNARTEEAMLAVELARAEYLKSRLRRLWTHLDRQHKGGSPGGSGFLTGTGEKQIEMDRRLVRRRIQTLRERLARIEARRERTIAARSELFQVALVGYTNAGKSTLMNALTGAGVVAEDRLFATLDTRTARLPLPRHEQVVLSDTVGFIRDLPPNLIASFHATLGEVREADLLIHVVDASSPAMERQIAVVEEVLAHIGADHIPAIMAFNKSDRPFSRTLVGACKKRYRHAVSISALTGAGLDELREAIAQCIDRRQQRLIVRFPIAEGGLLAFIRRRARIEQEAYDGEQAVLTIVADDQLQRELAEHPRLAIEPA